MICQIFACMGLTIPCKVSCWKKRLPCTVTEISSVHLSALLVHQPSVNLPKYEQGCIMQPEQSLRAAREKNRITLTSGISEPVCGPQMCPFRSWTASCTDKPLIPMHPESLDACMTSDSIAYIRMTGSWQLPQVE